MNLLILQCNIYMYGHMLQRYFWKCCTGLCSCRVRGVDGSCAKHLTERTFCVSCETTNHWCQMFWFFVRLGWVVKKVKVAHTRLPSVGLRSWSRFLPVSLQVTWVINPTVGCHYFPPGMQLPPQPDCDLNPGPSALESSTLTTRR